MKAHLLYRDSDFDLTRPLPWNAEALRRDLDLDRVFNAMSKGDPFLFDVAQHVILAGMSEATETMLYRQSILMDCTRRTAAIRELYDIAVETLEFERKNYLSSFLANRPEWVLRRSMQVMEGFLVSLRKVRMIADVQGAFFVSEGATTLFVNLKHDLSDDYLDSIQVHLDQVKFANGLKLSGRLGQGNKPTGYVLHAPPSRRSWWRRQFPPGPPIYRFSIHPRDEAGGQALAELRARGLNDIAQTLARSAEHVLGFFAMLRTELGFYVGCLNLLDRLAQIGAPHCLPTPAAATPFRLSCQGLYDITLALNLGAAPVGNNVDADDRNLIVVTGANQGGKSTFLRSVGVAQLMMQAGMYAPAEVFASSVCDGLFTHYKREEDTKMDSGKLDEEMSRMSDIVDHLTRRALVLFNESFAATNEREGSEISHQILSALLERGVRIVSVTHLYELARTLEADDKGSALFLRAERREDGSRSFRLTEGKPLETSFGEDLYRNIFDPPKASDRRPHAAAPPAQGA